MLKAAEDRSVKNVSVYVNFFVIHECSIRLSTKTYNLMLQRLLKDGYKVPMKKVWLNA